MGFKEKYIFGRAGVKDLILGLFFMFLIITGVGKLIEEGWVDDSSEVLWC